MGEIAEAILEGAMCQFCGEFFEDGDVGYPRTCAACSRETGKRPSPGTVIARVKCPTCGKKVKAAGLADHQRDVHQRTV